MAPTRRRTGTKGKRQTRARSLFQMVGGGAADKYVLLSCPEFNGVVDEIMEADGALLESGLFTRPNYAKFMKNGRRKNSPEVQELFGRSKSNQETKHYYRGFINWNSYDDGAPDIKMNKETTLRIRGAKVIFLLYLTFNENCSVKATSIVDQIIFLNSLSHYGVGEINIVLPYFPVGTMERVVGEGEIPTAYALSQMLNSIPEGSAKTNLYIFDIHALCSRFFFHTNSRPILVTMMNDYLTAIDKDYPAESNTNIIVFPDDGAKKRFDKMIPSKFNKITCAKVRDGEKRIIRIEDGFEHIKDGAGFKADIKPNLNFFIIDDLVQSGGTLLETMDGINKDILKLGPVKTLNYFPIVTHSVFPSDDKLKLFLASRDDRIKAKKEEDAKILLAKLRALSFENRENRGNVQTRIASAAALDKRLGDNRNKVRMLASPILADATTVLSDALVSELGKMEEKEYDDILKTLKKDEHIHYSAVLSEADYKHMTEVKKLITTDSRPLRVQQMRSEFGDKVSVIPISKAIHTLFSTDRDDRYITPYILN